MKKYTSRKFIAMLAGLFTGIGILLSGQTYEGVITVLISIGSYIAAEGIIDSKTASATTLAKELASAVADSANIISEEGEDA